MKKLLILLGVLAMFVVACGSDAPTSSRMPVPGSDVDETVVEESSFTDNIADLFRSGTAAKCTVTTPEGIATMYISGTNQRMDATANGDAVHSIVDSSYIYIWTDRENKGFKMSKRSLEDAASQGSSQYEGQTPESYASNPDAQVDCGAWLVDSSKFNPPSNVEFQDMDALLAQVQQMQQSGQIPDNFDNY